MSSNDNNRSPSEIQSDIRHTRGDLDRTLSALERRLEPRQLVDQGVNYLRDHGATQYVQNLSQAAKEQPLPLALVGVGLVWLMVTGRQQTHKGSTYKVGSGFSTKTKVRSAVDGAMDRTGELAADARQAAADVKDRVAEAGTHAADSVREAADSVRGATRQTAQALSDAAATARERAHRLGDATREKVDRVRNTYDDLVNEQPLALGAIGLAVGVLLASAAPRTRQEDEWMGSASDHVTDEARDAALDQVETVKAAVVAAKDAAVDTLGSSSEDARASTPANESSEQQDSDTGSKSANQSASASTPESPSSATGAPSTSSGSSGSTGSTGSRATTSPSPRSSTSTPLSK